MPSLAELARRLQARRRRAAERPLPGLVLMTDSRRLPDPLAAAARMPPGSAVILRHYDAPDRKALAVRLKQVCRRRGIRLLIAGDARLAAVVGADGLHLPEYMVARRGPSWRLWRRPGWLVTAAAHGDRALFRAARAGADAALLSPVFATASHPGERTLGPLRFTGLAVRAPLPVYALGGLDAAGARRLGGAPLAGFAGIGGIVPPG